MAIKLNPGKCFCCECPPEDCTTIQLPFFAPPNRTDFGDPGWHYVEEYSDESTQINPQGRYVDLYGPGVLWHDSSYRNDAAFTLDFWLDAIPEEGSRSIIKLIYGDPKKRNTAEEQRTIEDRTFEIDIGDQWQGGFARSIEGPLTVPGSLSCAIGPSTTREQQDMGSDRATGISFRGSHVLCEVTPESTRIEIDGLVFEDVGNHFKPDIHAVYGSNGEGDEIDYRKPNTNGTCNRGWYFEVVEGIRISSVRLRSSTVIVDPEDENEVIECGRWTIMNDNGNYDSRAQLTSNKTSNLGDDMPIKDPPPNADNGRNIWAGPNQGFYMNRDPIPRSYATRDIYCAFGTCEPGFGGSIFIPPSVNRFFSSQRRTHWNLDPPPFLDWTDRVDVYGRPQVSPGSVDAWLLFCLIDEQPVIPDSEPDDLYPRMIQKWVMRGGPSQVGIERCGDNADDIPSVDPCRSGNGVTCVERAYADAGEGIGMEMYWDRCYFDGPIEEIMIAWSI